jgi:hypothetical protein
VIWPHLRRLFGAAGKPESVLDAQRGAVLFAESLAELGAPLEGALPDDTQLARLRAQLPAVFVEMLAAHGFGHYNNRRFQFCDPELFRPLTDQLFRGDPDFDPKQCQLVGYTAFGEAVLWTGPHFVARLDFNTMQILCSDVAKSSVAMPAHLPQPAPSRDPNIRAQALLPFEPELIDFYDPYSDPLFDRAVAAFGALAAGEVFAFDPPLSAQPGVIPRQPLERMRRAPAFDAFSAAADAAPLVLVRIVRGRTEMVRPIGRA